MLFRSIAVAIDLRNDFLAIKGWVKQTKTKFFNFFRKIENYGITHIIYTDINRDGTKAGVNINKLKKIINKTNIPIVVSGGVSSISDIKILSKINNLAGVIIGKAIYDGSINLDQLKKL